MGACGKKPGVHYLNFDVWGEIMPPEAEIDTQCTTCFKCGVPSALGPDTPIVEAEPATSSCSSSSDSSGEESDQVVAPAGKSRKKARAAADEEESE